MIPAEVMEGFTFALAKGITALPVEGQRESTAAWIYLANYGDTAQRISAFMALLQIGVGIEVRMIEEARDGVVDEATG